MQIGPYEDRGAPQGFGQDRLVELDNGHGGSPIGDRPGQLGADVPTVELEQVEVGAEHILEGAAV